MHFIAKKTICGRKPTSRGSLIDPPRGPKMLTHRGFRIYQGLQLPNHPVNQHLRGLNVEAVDKHIIQAYSAAVQCLQTHDCHHSLPPAGDAV